MKVRLPDLWLKNEMALALAPPGTPHELLQNGVLASCVRKTGSASLFNKWKAGDEPMSISHDVHYLAATFQYLIGLGIGAPIGDKGSRPPAWNHETIQRFAGQSSQIALDEAMLGTFGHFARALLDLIRLRPDFEARGGAEHFEDLLEGIARKHLFLSSQDGAAPTGAIKLIHGETRHWAGPGGQRLARKEKRPEAEEIAEVPEGNFIQYLLPAPAADQIAFGFEVLSEGSLITPEWADICGWIEPRFQLAGAPLMLLDEPANDADAYKATVAGETLVQMVTMPVDAQLPGRVPRRDLPAPAALYSLTTGCPQSWPEGYAETMAALTYVRRRSRGTGGGSHRSAMPESAGEAGLRPTKLHTLRYRVV